MDANQQPGVLIAQVYLERVQFSHREDAASLPPNTPWEPNIQVGFQGALAADEQTAVREHALRRFETDGR